VPVLGVTGGIATGKSTFVQTFLRHLPAELFDADRSAHELLAQDELVIQRIHDEFGDEVFETSGKLSRGRLREVVFANEERRKVLEGILHPAIRDRWMGRAEQIRGTDQWMLVDIPLLFETGAETAFDRTIVVACSPFSQRHRLRERSGLDDSMIEKIIGAQLPLGAKIRKADHMIWNDSSVSCLDGQAGLLARWLTEYYG